MYRQILISSKDRLYQKILFRSSLDDKIEDYHLNTVTFGINCAPFLALRTLLQLADGEQSRFPLGSKILRESMYVDDALVGNHTINDALKALDQLIGILRTAGFELRKWVSNSKQIFKKFAPRASFKCNFFVT